MGFSRFIGLLWQFWIFHGVLLILWRSLDFGFAECLDLGKGSGAIAGSRSGRRLELDFALCLWEGVGKVWWPQLISKNMDFGLHFLSLSVARG